LAWTIDYSRTAWQQLKKLDRQAARRILDFVDTRLAPRDDPRDLGKALSGPLGTFWSYRLGDLRLICAIQDADQRILVLRLGKRDEVYR